MFRCLTLILFLFCFYFFIREVDKMEYNEPLTEEYYTEQKRLWGEMNNRNKINNASVLTNEQGFGFQIQYCQKRKAKF